MPFSGYEMFQMVLKDLKPAVQNTLKPVLEKCRSKAGAGVDSLATSLKVEEKPEKEKPASSKAAKEQRTGREKADVKSQTTTAANSTLEVPQKKKPGGRSPSREKKGAKEKSLS